MGSTDSDQVRTSTPLHSLPYPSPPSMSSTDPFSSFLDITTFLENTEDTPTIPVETKSARILRVGKEGKLKVIQPKWYLEPTPVITLNQSIRDQLHTNRSIRNIALERCNYYYYRKQYQLALDAIEPILKDEMHMKEMPDEQKWTFLDQLLHTYLHLHRHTEALQWAQYLIEAGKEGVEVMMCVAEMRAEMGELNAAITAYERVIELSPLYLHAWVALADLFYVAAHTETSTSCTTTTSTTSTSTPSSTSLLPIHFSPLPIHVTCDPSDRPLYTGLAYVLYHRVIEMSSSTEAGNVSCHTFSSNIHVRILSHVNILIERMKIGIVDGYSELAALRRTEETMTPLLTPTDLLPLCGLHAIFFAHYVMIPLWELSSKKGGKGEEKEGMDSPLEL